MRTQIALAALIGVAIISPALAGEHSMSRQHQPAIASISPETLRQKIYNLGYDLRRLEAEHGRFEAHMVDRQSGGAVEAVFDGATGELVQAKPKS